MKPHFPTERPDEALIQRLREKIHRAETSNRNDDGTIVSSGSAAIDNVLPAGGYHRGTIVQWHAPPGNGADFLSLLAAKHAAKEGGAIVIVDLHNRFYPPAARALGIALGNLIVLCNPNGIAQTHDQDFLWSIDQSLRCSAVAAVWGELPSFENPQMATRWLRRFQLSAESSGCCGMFVQETSKHRLSLKPSLQLQTTAPSAHPTLAPCWAEVQWQLQALPSITASGDTRRVRAKLVRCRGGAAGQFIDLEINTITGNVQPARCEHASRKHRTSYSLPLANQLAHPKTRRRATRA